MKTLYECLGTIMEREVQCDNGTFLVVVTKFGNTFGWEVLNSEGVVVKNDDPFKEVIEGMSLILRHSKP